jgi:uncharacterized protein (TIGR03083 family)
MTASATPVDQVPPISRSEAVGLAAAENQRVLELFRTLQADDWAKQTDCPAWDVRAMVAHLVGAMEGFSSFNSMRKLMRAANKAKGDGPMVDGMTASQVAARADRTTDQLIAEAAQYGPKQAKWRGSVPGLMRKMPLKQDVGGVTETWKMGYLFDVILTRDPWMHRVDITRATGREMVLTADHDGRLVADVVAEWARRHGQPFTLHLTGPAGGVFTQGTGGDELTLDAVEFCRTLSGRANGAGLLTQEVPF